MHIFQWIISVIILCCASILLFAANIFPTPYAASYSDVLFPVIWAGSSILLLIAFVIRRKIEGISRLIIGFAGVVSLVAMLLMLKQAVELSSWKKTVLSTDSDLLQTLGQHFIIGYRDEEEIRQLVQIGAVGGIYITARNIQGKSSEQISRFINDLQQVRQSAGLPQLIIAADQEGGIVSRLSPPLPKRKALGQFVKQFPVAEQQNVAYEYGKVQGEEIAGLGVNLNLSPVVDLIPDKTSPTDKYSLIHRRAISKQPELVSKLAQRYIEGLQCAGVLASIKHFPGLGRIYADTHREAAHITIDVGELEQHDWLPFKQITANTSAMMMVGHVHLDRIDMEYPASLSQTVLQTIIRNDWHYNGILITDDLTMDAIYQRENNHLQNTANTALRAGIDYLLISYDVRQFYPAMAGLIGQFKTSHIPHAILESSQKRISKLQQTIGHVPGYCDQ